MASIVVKTELLLGLFRFIQSQAKTPGVYGHDRSLDWNFTALESMKIF